MIIFLYFYLFASPEVYQQAVGGIVYIEVDEASIGSGFFINNSGTILTNYHVISNGRVIKATSKSGNVYRGIKVVGFDKRKDIAFLKIEGTLKDNYLKFNTAPYKVGDKVYVLGHPLNQKFSFTDGIISKIDYSDGVELIQTTAVVAPGSSGGPMLNSNGEVIGIIHSGMAEYQGINFGTGSDSILDRPLVATYSKMLDRMFFTESRKIANCRNRYAKDLREVDLEVEVVKGKIKSIKVEQEVHKNFSYCMAKLVRELGFSSQKDFTSTHRLNFY